MSEGALTREAIVEAAEEVLRRFGPRKANVVDVARALDVSHGTIYRHFPTKAALLDTVIAQWLERVEAPLDAIAEEPGPALVRLRRYFDQLRTFKQNKHREDPQLFATYHTLLEAARDVVQAHVDVMIGQVERILREGVAAGELVVDDPKATALSLFQATYRFHHPVHHAEWDDPRLDADFERLWAMLIAGFTRG